MLEKILRTQLGLRAMRAATEIIRTDASKQNKLPTCDKQVGGFMCAL